MFFEIHLIITKCECLEDIKLSTCVRIPVEHVLKLENPTMFPVVYGITSNCPYLHFHTSVEVAPLTEVIAIIFIKTMTLKLFLF